MTGNLRMNTDPADWSIYNGCLPRKIRLSDWDAGDPPGFYGFAEINYTYVLFERKKDTPSPDNFREGQEQALARLATVGGFSVITEILLKPPDGERQWRIWSDRRDSGWRSYSREEARDWLSRWGKRADLYGPLPLPPGALASGQKCEAPPSWQIDESKIARWLSGWPETAPGANSRDSS